MARLYKIILIENEEQDAFYIKKLFEDIMEANFQITWRTTIENATNELATNDFDSIFLDLGLAGSKNIDVVDELSKKYSNIPVIVLTGYNDYDMGCKAMQYGAQDYLVKGTFDSQGLYKAFLYAYQRKHIEKDLKDSEEKYRVLAENIQDYILRIDNKQNIIYLNKIAQRVFYENVDPKENDSIYDLFGKSKNILIWREKINDVFITKRPGQLQDEWYIKDKPVLFLDWHLYPEFDNKQNVCSILGVARDITHLKRTETELKVAKEKAEEGEKLKSSFLTNMSHELRTPLNAVIGFSELLNDNTQPDKIEEFAQVINESGKRLLEIIEEIFEISILETNNISVAKERFYLSEILPEIKDITENELIINNKKHLDFRVNLVPKTNNPLFLSDRHKLIKAITILIKNAIKFTNKGYIELGNIPKDEYKTEIYVKDTGVGIPPDKTKLIFTAFVQAEESSTRKFGGAGLGLTIAKKMIEYLDGKVVVNSKQGEGSKFSILLPVVESQKPDEKSKVPEKEIHSQIRKTKILVAEDEEVNFLYLETLLIEQDAEVVWAKNGLEATEKVSSDPDIDLVLMDIKMPIMDGYKATELIKKMKPNIPIIAQTAYALGGDDEKARQAGCDAYITKPIHPLSLKETIYKMLSKNA